MLCKIIFCVLLELIIILRSSFRIINERLVNCIYIFRFFLIYVLDMFKIFCNYYLKIVNVVFSIKGYFVLLDMLRCNIVDLLKFILWCMK